MPDYFIQRYKKENTPNNYCYQVKQHIQAWSGKVGRIYSISYKNHKERNQIKRNNYPCAFPFTAQL